MLPQLLVLSTCLSAVLSQCIVCKDKNELCSTLTDDQCFLRAARELCPKRCHSCGDLLLPPDTNPACVDRRDDCLKNFHKCATDFQFQRQCARTCERCQFPIASKNVPLNCRDQEPFCNTLTDNQCKLRIAKQRCPQRCHSCHQLPIPDDTSNQECYDAHAQCAHVFYICGVYKYFEKQCARTCELCGVTRRTVEVVVFVQPQHPEVNAMRSCISSFGKNFCTKLLTLCASIHEISLPSMDVMQLPGKVAECVASGDVVILCRAKYGDRFCNRLGAACSQLTNTPIPEVTSGPEYKLPEPIVQCISKENAMAMCYAEYCVGTCNAWRRACKITMVYGEMSEAHMKCMENHKFMAICFTRYGSRNCITWVKACKLDNWRNVNGLTEMEKSCMRSQNILTACQSKYDKKFCHDLEIGCSQLLQTEIPSGPVRIIPQNVAWCMKKESFIAICYARYGMKNCKRWMTVCEITMISFTDDISEEQKNCLRIQSALWTCIEKNGAEFCTKLESSCCSLVGIPLPYGNVHILPVEVARCIAKEHFLAVCYARYGSESCQGWMRICQVTFTKFSDTVTAVQKDCIRIQSAMAMCKQKYSQEFCKQLEAGCCSIVGVSLPVTNVHVLPVEVSECISKADFIAICHARYGSQKCMEWMQICKVTYTSIGDEITEVKKDCIRIQSALSTCITKYNQKFCYDMESGCCSIVGVPLPVGSVHIVPITVARCVSHPNFIAICYARYGAENCRTWMSVCQVTLMDYGNGITTEQTDCIRIQSAQSTCLSRYDRKFCKDLEAGCRSLHRLSVYSSGSSSTLAVTVARCISKGDFVPVCYARHGAKVCQLWMRTCQVSLEVYARDGITTVQKDCMQFQIALSLCQAKHDEKYCQQLQNGCFAINGIVMSSGAVLLVPAAVSKCVSQEDFFAVCYARFGAQKCKIWMRKCNVVYKSDGSANTEIAIDCVRFQSAFTSCSAARDEKFCMHLEEGCCAINGVPVPTTKLHILPSGVSRCMAKQYFIAVCYAKYGAEKCRIWMETCRMLHTDFTTEISEEMKDCIRIQSALSKCSEKHNSKFCSDLESGCCSIIGVSLPIGPIHILPITVARCIAKDNFIAMCYARYGAENCGNWMKACRITYTENDSGVTQVNKDCIQFQSSLSQCITKYDEKFCMSLQTGCFTLVGIPVPSGPLVAVPTTVLNCVSREDFLAVCIARFGVESCKTWMHTCKIVYKEYSNGITIVQETCMRTQSAQSTCVSRYDQTFCYELEKACRSLIVTHASDDPVQASEAIRVARCVAKVDFVAACYARFGAESCMEWLKTCSVTYRTYGSELTDVEMNCVRFQSAISTCISKHGEKFCVELEAGCCALSGVPVPSGAVHIVPITVARCIAKGDFIAICYARHKAEQCVAWLRKCRPADAETGEELSASQKDCIRTQSALSTCLSKHSRQYCTELEAGCCAVTHVPLPVGTLHSLPYRVTSCILKEDFIAICYANYGANNCKRWMDACKVNKRYFIKGLPEVKKDCITYQSVLTRCIAKYGPRFCDDLKTGCFRSIGIRLPVGPVLKIPLTVSKCMQREDFLAVCFARYGADKCTVWMQKCEVIQRKSSNGITEIQKTCIRSLSSISACVVKYDQTFCTKLETGCRTLISVSQTSEETVSVAVAKCVAEGDFIAICYAKYGASNCAKWMRVCRVSYTSYGTALRDVEMNCIRFQSAQARCLTKYDRKFCMSLEAGCCSMFGIPVPTGQLHIVPLTVARCISKGNFIGICYARYGAEKCMEWMRICKVTQISYRDGLSETTKDCITTQSTLSACITKYGKTFCLSLESGCCAIAGVPLPVGTVHIVPSAVAACISTRDFIAICYARYGSENCKTWMQMCRVSYHNYGDAITEIQKDCIRIQSAQSTCLTKYDEKFCRNLEAGCCSLHHIPVPTSSMHILPITVARCISKGNFIAVCYARYGAERCMEWMSACSITYTINSGEQITDVQMDCMRMRSAMTTCVTKYNKRFCVKLESGCCSLLHIPIPHGPVHILPLTVARCISRGDFIGVCYAKYGAANCTTWMRTCKVTYHTDGSDITEVEKDCIRYQNAISSCLAKYDEKFCQSLESGCCSIVGLPVPTGGLHIVPAKVARCISHEDFVGVCYARYGVEKCTTWLETCKITYTNFDNELTVVQKDCVRSQNVLSSCISRYGRKFCTDLESVCCSRLSVSVPLGSVHKLPETVVKCISDGRLEDASSAQEENPLDYMKLMAEE